MLIAFNGTGNKDEDNNNFDTNVTKIVEAYQGNVYYQDGVGTGGWLDKLFGGVAGFGGKGRVKNAVKHLVNNNGYEIQNDFIDVVGFSRGSALAIDFCNEIEKLGYKVRCLMLFDTVASFGLAGNDINIGYNLDTPTNCQHILHAMSLDERRKAFPLTRVGGEEMWFRGFHSDIGGGNGNIGLNTIPLVWVMRKATALCGIKFDKASFVKYKLYRCSNCDCSKPTDLFPNALRYVSACDKVHSSVSERELACKGFPANNPSQIGLQTFEG